MTGQQLSLPTAHGLQRIWEEIDAELAVALADVEAYIGWSYLESVLDYLPIESGEYSLAINRLRNGRRYAAEGECGAAEFELRQLSRRLATKSDGRAIPTGTC